MVVLVVLGGGCGAGGVGVQRVLGWWTGQGCGSVHIPAVSKPQDCSHPWVILVCVGTYIRTYVHMYVVCIHMYCGCCVFGLIVVLHDLGFELVKHCGWPLGLWATGEPARVPPWSMYFVLKRIIDYRYRFILLASVVWCVWGANPPLPLQGEAARNVHWCEGTLQSIMWAGFGKEDCHMLKTQYNSRESRPLQT